MLVNGYVNISENGMFAIPPEGKLPKVFSVIGLGHSICQLPSFRYNFETNHEISMRQYNFIEHDILGILGQ